MFDTRRYISVYESNKHRLDMEIRYRGQYPPIYCPLNNVNRKSGDESCSGIRKSPCTMWQGLAVKIEQTDYIYQSMLSVQKEVNSMVAF